MNRNALILSLFLIASIAIGFIPNVYEWDKVWFIANQVFWVFATVIFRLLSHTKEEKIISESLVVLTSFELIDEIAGINSYVPDVVQRVLTLDAIVCIFVILFTIKRLASQWKKKTYS